MNVNPFILEVIKDSLLSIGEEMFIALEKTSMSPMFYEALDYACGLTDHRGNLVSQGNGVTSFIGMLSPMVKTIIAKFNNGKDLSEGDIIIINDPYQGGGSHLSDVGFVMPIFYKGELIAFSTNKGHWTEVGGMDPGSFTNNSTEIYQEGLQFPGVKVFEQGRVNQGIIEIIKSNVRLPDQSLGDMWAQVAALRTGEKRIQEVCDRYGVDKVKLSIEKLLKQGEEYAKNALKKLPKGTFYASDFIEGESFSKEKYPIQVKVTITEEKFICDFRGSHPQVKLPINCSYYGLMASVRVMFLAIIQPIKEINEGVFSLLEILVDKGSIVSATRPAPVSMNFEARLGGADLIWKALAKEIPHQLPAGHLLSVSSVLISGPLEESETDFLLVEPSVGGWGAGMNFDGQNGQFCMGDGETYNIPIEIAESRYGVLVDEYSLIEGSGGIGKYRGGLGVKRVYRALTDNQRLSIRFGRHQTKPWGVNGGQEGQNSNVIIKRRNGITEPGSGIINNIDFHKGDKVILMTPGGGGNGNPNERSKEAIESDLKNGYITSQQAQMMYSNQ